MDKLVWQGCVLATGAIDATCDDGAAGLLGCGKEDIPDGGGPDGLPDAQGPKQLKDGLVTGDGACAYDETGKATKRMLIIRNK